MPQRVKADAEVLAAARAPLSRAGIELRFNGRSSWKKRVPQIFGTLIAVAACRS